MGNGNAKTRRDHEQREKNKPLFLRLEHCWQHRGIPTRGRPFRCGTCAATWADESAL